MNRFRILKTKFCRNKLSKLRNILYIVEKQNIKTFGHKSKAHIHSNIQTDSHDGHLA